MKKEKYIVEKEGKKGITLEVKIPYYNGWGQRVYHSKSFNTKDYPTNSDALHAACTYRNKLLIQLQTVGSVPNKKVTVKDCYDLTKKAYSFTKETQRKHDIRFKYLSKYHNMPISKITAFDVQLSLNELSDKSQDVIKSVFAIWKQIYKTAIMNDYVFQDQTIKVTVPKSEKLAMPKSVEMTCSLNDVVAAIREYGHDSFNANIIAYAMITIAYLGLRPSEAYALTRSDLDFSKRTISITKAIGSTSKDAVAIKTTKNINSIRIMPMPDELIPVLQDCIRMQPSEYLFATDRGEFITSRKYSNYIHNAMKKAGLDFRPYMLRHLFSTKLVTSHTDIRTVQELMGHKNINMTISYARSTDELKRIAINKISV